MATREEIEAEEYAALNKPDLVLRAPVVAPKVEASVVVEADVQEAMAAIEVALDSKEIALAMRKVVAKRLMRMVGENKVGAGDMVKLLGMVADRVDGKVADQMKVEGSLLPSNIEISFVSPERRKIEDRGVIENDEALL